MEEDEDHRENLLQDSTAFDFDDIHSDYQWFNESGFEGAPEGGFPTPLCLAGESSEENFDATMAHVDIEDFSAHRQHMMLKFPPMVGSDFLHGETLASITGSILEQLDFSAASSTNLNLTNDPASASIIDPTVSMSMEMSICKSENLFSPMDDPLPLSTFSTDSLDTRGEILANCMATNANNYTIAFQGMEESTTSSSYKTPNDLSSPVSNFGGSDSGSQMTNWRMCQRTSRAGINNNNNGSNEGIEKETKTNNPIIEDLSRSFQGPEKVIRLKKPKSKERYMKEEPLKIFDIRGKMGSSSNLSIKMGSSTATSTGAFSGSSRDSSTSIHIQDMDSSGTSWNMNNNYNNSGRNSRPKGRFSRRETTTTDFAEAIKKSRSIQIQTSQWSLFKRGPNERRERKKSPVFVCFPSYTLPDLKFLSESLLKDDDVYFLPQKFKKEGNKEQRNRRPFSCTDFEDLRKKGLTHVKDWESLNFLLPGDVKEILGQLDICEKPVEKRELRDDEKEKDDAVGNEEKNVEINNVVMRRKKNQRNPEKRWSQEAGGVTRGLQNRFKRFSLQETVPEVREITSEIARNLQELEDLASTFRSPVPNPLMESTSKVSSGCGTSFEIGRRAPANTPKEGSSFTDNNPKLPDTPTKERRRQHVDIEEKEGLTKGIASSVTLLASSFDEWRDKSPNAPAVIMSCTPCGKLVLESLCPALYLLLSDGLCPFLETIFGRVPNTVWRVVEASIQYGPTAQTLNELVLRINSEELLAEGPMKFNAFICGLLNLGNLGSWLTFLRTKERLVRSHYESGSFLYSCNTVTRCLYDQMLVNIHSLSRLPFHLDIFHETKLLHQSINNSKGPALPVKSKIPGRGKSDPRAPLKAQSKNSKFHANLLKKSQMKRSLSDERPKTSKEQNNSTLPKSKTASNVRKLNKEDKSAGILNEALLRFPSRPRDLGLEKGMAETKTRRPSSIESLEKLAGDSKDPERFRRLQQQWELLSSEEKKLPSPSGSNPPSKIPRPITSPIRGAGNSNCSNGLYGPNVRPSTARR